MLSFDDRTTHYLTIMQTPATPATEQQRLAALYELLLLDTPPEQRFDTIVDFAASEFDVPICLITLLDHDRQWFKARAGLAACSTPRDISFCGHAILQPDVMVVPDATADPRFSDNPLVTSDPNIRFYAGAPLILPSGHAVGTLCIIDTKPRTLDKVELSILESMRDLLVMELGRTGKDISG
jgi:GAF domain-containing protein